MSPPAPEVRSVAHESFQSLEEGDAKDFRPGKRTLWELPVLGPVADPNPAMRFSDWVHRVTPFFNDWHPGAMNGGRESCWRLKRSMTSGARPSLWIDHDL